MDFTLKLNIPSYITQHEYAIFLVYALAKLKYFLVKFLKLGLNVCT